MSVDVTVIDGLAYDVQPVVADGERVLAAFGLPDCELSVLLCDDATIHPLNRDWRGKDRPTDVLSFSQCEQRPEPGASEMLGDVIISLETARSQAESRGHALTHEVRVLLVHGICHLLGYDHERDDEAEVMEARERELLVGLG